MPEKKNPRPPLEAPPPLPYAPVAGGITDEPATDAGTPIGLPGACALKVGRITRPGAANASRRRVTSSVPRPPTGCASRGPEAEVPEMTRARPTGLPGVIASDGAVATGEPVRDPVWGDPPIGLAEVTNAFDAGEVAGRPALVGAG